MFYDVIDLKNDYKKLPYDDGSQPRLHIYAHNNTKEIDIGRTYPAVLICPGGGYGGCSDREAEPVALQFFAQGYNAYVLYYSVRPARYPTQIMQVAAALDYIRTRNSELHQHVDKIALCGFSAGGHLVGSYCNEWSADYICKALAIKQENARPNLQILCYAVLSTDAAIAHAGSFNNLLGERPDPDLLGRMSAEKNINDHTPPAFLWHTCTDDVVDVQNSLLYASAMATAGRPVEMHIYPYGTHGLSLADRRTCNDGNAAMQQPHVASWMGLCLHWLDLMFG